MSAVKKAKSPFRFFTRLHLTELTGLKASNLLELLELIKEVPGSCIYHHTHRFLQLHQYLSPEPPNDFAFWVIDVLGEDELGETLASIDTIQYSTIRALRERIEDTIAKYLKNHPQVAVKFANPGDEFYFKKTVSFILPTDFVANNLKDFAQILEKITFDAIYFHMFEARLRLEKGTNDFSYWIETSLGDKQLANQIDNMDPYTYTLDDLRKKIINLVKKRIE